MLAGLEHRLGVRNVHGCREADVNQIDLRVVDQHDTVMKMTSRVEIKTALRLPGDVPTVPAFTSQAVGSGIADANHLHIVAPGINIQVGGAHCSQSNHAYLDHDIS